MKPFLFGGALIVIGFLVTEVSGGMAALLILGGIAVIGISLYNRRAPKAPPPPTAHAAARAEGREMERAAKRRARKIVKKAVKSEDQRGRAAIAAAQERLANEARESWVA